MGGTLICIKRSISGLPFSSLEEYNPFVFIVAVLQTLLYESVKSQLYVNKDETKRLDLLYNINR